MNAGKFVRGYRFTFNGQFCELDIVTGLYSYMERQFNPSYGRWISPDPAGQYYSPYIVLGNNPIVRVDPNGMYDTKFGAWLNKVLFGGKEVIYSKSRGEWGVEYGIDTGIGGVGIRYGGPKFSISGSARVDYGLQGGIKVGALGTNIGVYGAYETKPLGDIYLAYTPTAESKSERIEGHCYDIIANNYTDSRLTKTEVDLSFGVISANNTYELGEKGKIFDVGSLKSTSLSIPIYGTKVAEYSNFSSRRIHGYTRYWTLIEGKIGLIIGVQGEIKIGYTYNN